MQAWHLVGVRGQQTCLQDVGEQVVVAVPGALGVERDEEQVVALEVVQHAGAFCSSGDRVTQRTGESVEDGGAEQELADVWWLPGQDLVGEVVDDEPVAPGEGVDEARDLTPLGDAAQREGGELKAGDPPFGALLQRVRVGGGELQPHHLVEELSSLVGGEAQIGGAQLDELSASPEPGHLQRWIGPGRDHQVHLIGDMVEEEGHCFVHVGRFDDVIVVEHEDPLLPRCLCTGAGELVDERRLVGGARGGVHGLEGCRVDVEAGAVQRCHQVRQEPPQVVVAVVEGDPRDVAR